MLIFLEFQRARHSYHRISASFVPGLTEHSSVATSGEITVTSVTPPSSFGASPTANVDVYIRRVTVT